MPARPDTAATVTPVRFRHRGGNRLGVEAMSLAELRRRASPAELSRPQRVEFELLLLCTGGRGRHEVDFVGYPLSRGTLISVRPGQVHRFHLDPSTRGVLVIVDPGFELPARLAWYESSLRGPWRAPHVRLDAATVLDVLAAAAAIGRDSTRHGTHPEAPTLLRQHLHVLWMRLKLALEPGQPRPAPGPAARLVEAYEMLLAGPHAQRWTVAECASRLGYAERTLTRACQAVRGRSAKQLLDARVVLEAKRLLAHTDEPVAAVAVRLRFSEPSNFIQFFKRIEGRTPLDFRGRLRAGLL